MIAEPPDSDRELIFDTVVLNHFALTERLDVLASLVADRPSATTVVVVEELRARTVREPLLARASDLEWMRERLGVVLPAVMVPSAWVVLDRLPLTANGKLDRAGLPEPPASRPAPDPAATTMDETTARLREIWQDVLKIGQIDPEDDLFDLGGHSLTITRIIARVHQLWGVTVPLETFYDTPTLAEVAAAVRELRAAAQPV